MALWNPALSGQPVNPVRPGQPGQPVNPVRPGQPGQPVNAVYPEPTYASWGERVLAFVIDYLGPALLVAVGAVLGWPHKELAEREFCDEQGRCFRYTVTVATSWGLAFFVCLMLGFLFLLWNKGYREGSTGKSIGKQITGQTTVSDTTGRPLGFGKATIRWILLWLDFLIAYVGVLWPLWDRKHRCLLSDKLTGAVVHKDR